MSKFSAKNAFASRVICEDCGCFYGQKVWHSNDKYRRVVYRCNSKFYKSHQKCQTPTLDEQTLKEAFVKAYNSFMNNKDQVVEDCIEMIKILDNTATLESEIKGIREEIEVIVELVNKLVSENATKAMPQEEFLKKYNDYDLKYKALADKLNSKEDEHQKRLVQAKSMRAFIEALKQKAGTITEWDEDLMIYFIDEIRVSRNKVLTFRFKNGTDVAI